MTLRQLNLKSFTRCCWNKSEGLPTYGEVYPPPLLLDLDILEPGGGERVRTDGLLRARQALSQLSYTPE